MMSSTEINDLEKAIDRASTLKLAEIFPITIWVWRVVIGVMRLINRMAKK